MCLVPREALTTKEAYEAAQKAFEAEVYERAGSNVQKFKQVLAEYRAPILAKCKDDAERERVNERFRNTLPIGFPALKQYLHAMHARAAERELLFTKSLFEHLRTGAHAMGVELLNMPKRDLALDEPAVFLRSLMDSADWCFRCVLTGEYEGDIASTRHIPKPTRRFFEDTLVRNAAPMMADDSVKDNWPLGVQKEEVFEYQALYKQDTGPAAVLQLRLKNAVIRMVSTQVRFAPCPNTHPLASLVLCSLCSATLLCTVRMYLRTQVCHTFPVLDRRANHCCAREHEWLRHGRTLPARAGSYFTRHCFTNVVHSTPIS